MLESQKTRVYVQKPAVQEYHLCILDVYVRVGGMVGVPRNE